MASFTFAATRVTERMINRIEELETLGAAIFDPGSDNRVAIIEGEGGLGKTRLLQEVRRRAGSRSSSAGSKKNDPKIESWGNNEEIVISNSLLDFADVGLHTFLHFIRELRKSFTSEQQPEVDFSSYDRARAYHQRKLDEQADFLTIREAAQAAENSFFDDYNRIAEQKRLVWLLDTAEQLTFMGADWLFEEGLLTPKDLSFNTQQRLLTLLEAGEISNTTIILAGRRREAKRYFDALKDKEKQTAGNYRAIPLKLTNFNQEDTRAYLAELAENWSEQAPGSEVTEYLQFIIEDTDRADVLWLYTGGQPVRLALYIDVLAEGEKEPEALQSSVAEAKASVGWNETTKTADNEKIEAIQFKIEDEFIKLIFSKADELRPQILRILAQAHRGLNEHELHYILDAEPVADIAAWEENSARLEEIRQALAEMRSFSFVKTRPGGSLILQDEMYRIYDEHAANDEETRKDEIQARRALYRHLLTFIEKDIVELVKQKARYLAEDERSLRWESPARALSMRFRFLTDEDLEARSRLNERIRQAHLEKLHYLLRLDPNEAFNDTYTQHGHKRTFTS